MDPKIEIEHILECIKELSARADSSGDKETLDELESQQLISALERRLTDIIDQNTQVIFNFAVQAHLAGDLVTAAREYERLLSIGPLHEIALMNLGVIAKGAGRFEEAITYYRAAIAVNDQYLEAHLNLGRLLLEREAFGEARVVYQEALKLSPESGKIHNNLGYVLLRCGEVEASISSCHRALQLEPKTPETSYNLGRGLEESGRFEEASHAYRQTIQARPHDLDARFRLGLTLQRLGEMTEALELMVYVIESAPQHSDLASSIVDLIRQNTLYLIERSPDRLHHALSVLLHLKSINHLELWGVIERLLPRDQAERWLTDHRQRGDAQRPSGVLDARFLQIIEHPLLNLSLQKFCFCAPLWEAFLTQTRAQLCALIYADQLDLVRNLSHLLYSLAEQCFLNEYVYRVTSQESIWLEAISAEVSSSRVVNELRIGLLGCYRALNSIPAVADLLEGYRSADSLFNDLTCLQLIEPIRERQLISQVKSLDTISDRTSQAVRAQYEEHPYPRWRWAPSYALRRASPEHVVQVELGRDQPLQSIRPQGTTHQLLIAGCGTGQQVLQAQRYNDVQITAIDLSRSSIAYAMRKSAEAGMERIEFWWGDLLTLPTHNKTFDLIECSGVLHHLKTPERGLSALTQVLKPGGYMKLGLYSALARRSIVEARTHITEAQYPPTVEGIRACRQHILYAKDHPLLYQVTGWSDFYALSSCRDLIFHVQEHRFTLPLIETLLHRHGLEFLGFILGDAVESAYRVHHPDDPKMVDLKRWHQFEEEAPDTFRSMYQFWVRRR